MFLKILLNSQVNTCGRASFSIRLQAWPVTFTKETLTQKYFCEFFETFRNNYSVEHLQMADYGFWRLSTCCNNTYSSYMLQQHIHFPHVATRHTLSTHCNNTHTLSTRCNNTHTLSTRCNNTFTFHTLQQHIHFLHVTTTHTVSTRCNKTHRNKIQNLNTTYLIYSILFDYWKISLLPFSLFPIEIIEITCFSE